jgi:HNH endonuclease
MCNLDFENVTKYSQGAGSRSSKFKSHVKEFYGFSGNNRPESDPPGKDEDLFDMATGEKLRHGSVIAAHIFQFRWRGCLSVFTSLTDINDVSNALLLYKPVEDAFDRARLCIYADAGSMRFCLLDKALQTTKLVDRAVALRKAAKLDIPLTPVEMALEATFGDLDGRELFFPEGCSKRPSKRLLTLHARAALLFAKSHYDLPETAAPYLDQDMTWSVSDDSQAQVALDHLSM